MSSSVLAGPSPSRSPSLKLSNLSSILEAGSDYTSNSSVPRTHSLPSSVAGTKRFNTFATCGIWKSHCRSLCVNALDERAFKKDSRDVSDACDGNVKLIDVGTSAVSRRGEALLTCGVDHRQKYGSAREIRRDNTQRVSNN